VSPSHKRVPADTHEWVSFDDPDEERTWLFDVTFLVSAWTCIFGHGCQGVLTGPSPELVQGCCSYGAHFTGKKDARTVERAAADLTPDLWQFHKQGQKGVVKKLADGDLGTRLVDGACIFLNRPGFAGGAGCALHLAAIDAGDSPIDYKPSVCWQLPVKVDWEDGEDGTEVATLRGWTRADWGPEGETMAWCCTEGTRAYVGDRPVIESLAEELEAITGPEVYLRLRARLED